METKDVQVYIDDPKKLLEPLEKQEYTLQDSLERIDLEIEELIEISKPLGVDLTQY